MIVMLIDDLVGADVDPALEGALVVFNASPEAMTQTVAGARRAAASRCRRCRRTARDPVVKTTTWDAATGTVTVPARSVAVLVDTRPVDTGHRARRQVGRQGGHDRQGHGSQSSRRTAAPGGTVTVTDNGKVIATVSWAAAKGRFDIALPKLGRGIHLLRARSRAPRAGRTRGASRCRCSSTDRPRS